MTGGTEVSATLLLSERGRLRDPNVAESLPDFEESP
jgi:hypothetical protein